MAAGGEDRTSLVARLAEVIRANYLRVDDPDEPVGEAEAREAARRVLQRVLDRSCFPRLCIERSLLFAVEEGAAPGGGDLLHVLAWNGERWVAVDALPLPADGRERPARGRAGDARDAAGAPE